MQLEAKKYLFDIQQAAARLSEFTALKENAMADSALEAKAHELLGQLEPGKLAAVVHLLEVMVRDDEPVTEEDRRRLRDGQSWFAQRDGKGIPMEDVLADFGLKPEDFPPNK